MRHGGGLAPARGHSHVGARGRGLWRKGRPRFPGREAKGDILFWKENVPPGPPKEKRGGISISPRTPLKRHKGRGPRPPPLETNPQGDGGRGQGPSPLETPPGARRGSGSGKRSRGRPICSPGVRCAYRCGNAVPDGTGLAQPVGDFRIWSEVRDSQPPFRVI